MAYQYYYCPFLNPDQTTLNTMAKYQAKGAGRCVIVDTSVVFQSGTYVTINGKQAGLGVVPADAVLLIDGHGSSRSSFGRSNTGLAALGKAPVIVPTTDPNTNDIAALTPYRLAQLLIREGLPTTHRAIRMLTCYGAGPASAYKGMNVLKMIRSKNHRDAYEPDGYFARSLAKTMSKLGYNQIVVGGYCGPTINNSNNGRTKVEIDATDEDTMVLAGSDKGRYMAWFDGQGKKVAKPQGLRSQANP